jgi:hypothetical protein
MAQQIQRPHAAMLPVSSVPVQMTSDHATTRDDRWPKQRGRQQRIGCEATAAE